MNPLPPVTPLNPTAVTSYGTPDIFAGTYNVVTYGDDLSADTTPVAQWAQTFETRADTAPETMFQFGFGTGAVTCTTVATAGITLTTMAANAAADVDTLIVGGKTNVLIIQGGNADAVGGATAAQIATRMWAVTTPRHGAGWNKVIVIGMLQSSGNISVYAATNADLKAAYAANGVDGYVDVTMDAVLGALLAYANLLYFNSNQLTLNENGVIRYNDQLVIPIVKAVLGL